MMKVLQRHPIAFVYAAAHDKSYKQFEMMHVKFHSYSFLQ